jgi:hypothetical protein
VPQLLVLVNASGLRWSPIKRLRLEGVTFAATAYSYMQDHAAPSGGDFSLAKYAAVILENTVETLVQSCKVCVCDHGCVQCVVCIKGADHQYSSAIVVNGYINNLLTAILTAILTVDTWGICIRTQHREYNTIDITLL